MGIAGDRVNLCPSQCDPAAASCMQISFPTRSLTRARMLGIATQSIARLWTPPLLCSFISSRGFTPAMVEPSRTIDAADWMAGFFLGATEEELLSDRKRFIDTTSIPGELALRHVDGQTTWRAGRFDTLSIEDLRQQAQAAMGTTPPRAAPLPIIVEDGVDIGRAQARLTSDDRAMVQIASNFNCLEVPSRTCAPDYGSLVTNYAIDATQGPAASFGVPAASLLRAHYAFCDGPEAVSGSADASVWGQTSARQIDLLCDVTSHFGWCVNGKVTLRGDEEPLGSSDDQVKAVAEQIRIGLHTDAEVVFDRAERQPTSRGVQLGVLPSDARPLVDQVLSASVNLNSPGEVGGPEADREERLDNLVRAALRAAYQGAYLAAILRERRTLLLTLIGGGVFGNRRDAILQAMAEAHAEWAPRSKLEHVRLCLYAPGSAEAVDADLRARLATL